MNILPSKFRWNNQYSLVNIQLISKIPYHLLYTLQNNNIKKNSHIIILTKKTKSQHNNC